MFIAEFEKVAISHNFVMNHGVSGLLGRAGIKKGSPKYKDLMGKMNKSMPDWQRTAKNSHSKAEISALNKHTKNPDNAKVFVKAQMKED